MSSPLHDRRHHSSRTHRHGWRLMAVTAMSLAVLVGSLTGSLLSPTPASATTPAPSASSAVPALSASVPAVTVQPTDTTASDPNNGNWFVFDLKPGRSASTLARIVNPADVAQTVSLSIRDLLFTASGTPYLNPGRQTDVGAWAHFDQPAVTLGPRTSTEVPLQVTVPTDAVPGDHFGAVVATSEPEQVKGDSALRIVKRVAVRMYVTVPGVAVRSFRIGGITSTLDSWAFPRYATVTVLLRNTGRIQLDPQVSVAGRRASGPSALLARSVEAYTARVPIPLYGGPVNESVVVRTPYPGLTRSADHSEFAVPWGLIGLLFVLAWVVFGLAQLVRWRINRMRRLRADLRRLEALVVKRPGLDLAAAAPLPPGGGSGGPTGAEAAVGSTTAVAAMESAIKRARRTGHLETLPELALALHETGGDALDVLLESIPLADGRRPDLLAALARYPAGRIQASPRLAQLSGPERARLASAGAGVVGELSAGPRGGTGPAPRPAFRSRAVSRRTTPPGSDQGKRAGPRRASPRTPTGSSRP